MHLHLARIAAGLTLVVAVYITWDGGRYLQFLFDHGTSFRTLFSSPLIMRCTTLLATCASFLPLTSTQSFESSCSALASSLSIPNVRVNIAEYVPSGTNITFPDNV